MRNIRKIIREHRRAAIVALLVVVLFVAGSAASAIRVSNDRSHPRGEVRTEQTERSNRAPSGAKDGANGKKDGPTLTSDQRKAVAAYDDDTKALVDTLRASVWTAEGGKANLRFKATSYTESANGKAETHSYAIARIAKTSDTSGAQTDTIVFLTDTGTHIATLQTLTGTGAGDATDIKSTLASSTMFTLTSGGYERAAAARSITVKGLNGDIAKLLGGNTDGLTDALSRWCASYYPTATEATWEPSAVIDYKAGTVSTNFTLNTETPVRIAATYRMAEGTFEFDY